MALHTKDIKNVQIAFVGKTYNAQSGPIKFTREDFDDMVDAAETLVGKVDFPVKLGHNDEQQLLQEDGLPAAGWIENVRRLGNVLVADLMKVPSKIADIMEAGGLRKRSLEAHRNLELAGQRFKFVLTGLALLGEELPAVDSLDDIVALYPSAKLDWPDPKDEEATSLVFIVAAHDDDNDDDVEDMIREIQRITGQGDSLVRHALGNMISEIRRVGKTKAQLGEDEMDLKELEMSRAAIVEQLGLDAEVSDEDMAKAIKDLQSKVKAGEAGGANDGDGNKPERDAELSSMKKENETQAARILALENTEAMTKATDAADAAIKASKFAPAVRGNLIKMALANPEDFTDADRNRAIRWIPYQNFFPFRKALDAFRK